MLEFDLNTLEDEKCRALEAYVAKCNAQSKKQGSRTQPPKPKEAGQRMQPANRYSSTSGYEMGLEQMQEQQMMNGMPGGVGKAFS